MAEAVVVLEGRTVEPWGSAEVFKCRSKRWDARAVKVNIALEKVIRNSGIQTRGTIFFKTVQILAYADDIDLMPHTTPGLNEAFLKLEKSARNMGLIINQEKTVWMYSGQF